jgi:hypothetical protein
VILVITPSTFSTNEYTKLNKHNQNDIESNVLKYLSLFELLETSLDAIASPESDWSNVTPRYVTPVFDSMTCPLQTTLK